MTSTRRVWIYLATLVASCAAILGVLHLGSEFDAIVASPPETDLAMPLEISVSASQLQVLRQNLDHPFIRLLIQLLVVIAASRFLGHALKHFGMASVIGDIVAGILLGPSLLGWVAPTAFAFVFPANSLGALSLLSLLGACLFMFGVGMDLRLSQVRCMAQTAVAVSHTSILVPFALGVALAYPLFRELAGDRATFTSFALFMGISMSITAFPVLASILRERQLIQTRLGDMAIACAAVEDVTAWSILTVVAAVATSNGTGETAIGMVLAIAFVAIMFIGVRRALPYWFGHERMTAEEPSDGTLAMVALVLFGAAFCTEVIGIHALLGAFLAGTVMPNVGAFRHRIGVRMEKLGSTILLPLFFAFTGLRTQISEINDLQGWLLCLVIIVVATVGKLGAGAAAARLGGMSWRESLQLGALINTRGLMELIALNIGYDLGILSSQIFTMLVMMALATTLMTGPLLTLFGRLRLSASKQQRQSHHVVGRMAATGAVLSATCPDGNTFANSWGSIASTDFLQLSASEMTRRIRSKQLSAVQVVKACYARIDAVNPRINAVVAFCRERALAEAAEADAMLAAGKVKGPLHGVPFTATDSFDTEGVVSSGGTLGRKDYIPGDDATLVQRARHAGAILLGKTNTSELTLGDGCSAMNLVYGVTRNPYNLNYQPSGSSGGAGAIVAAYGSVFDLSSDCRGSICSSAFANGIAGIKPTLGRIPRTGHIIGCSGAFDSFQQSGLLSRRVIDLALLMQIICGPDDWDTRTAPVPLSDPAKVDLKTLRVAYYKSDGMQQPAPEIQSLVTKCVGYFSNLGCTITEDRPPRMKELSEIRQQFEDADGREHIRALLRKHGTRQASPGLRLDGKVLSSPTFTQLCEEMDAIRSEQLAWFSGYDLIVCPASNRALIPIDYESPEARAAGNSADSYTSEYNTAGWPAGVVCAGISTNDPGLPLGIQVVAQPWRDDVVLAALAHIENQTGGWQAPPI